MPLLVGLEAGGPNNAPRRSVCVVTKTPVGKDQPPVARKPQQRQKDKPSRPVPDDRQEDTSAIPCPGIRGSGSSHEHPVGQQHNCTIVQVGESLNPGTGTKQHTRKVALPAEMGWPETSAEFVQWMKSQFVLREPRERTEGGEITNKVSTTQTSSRTALQAHASASNKVTDTADVPNEDLVLIPLTFLDNDKTLSKVKNHYNKDSFFKMIMDSPKTCWNFEGQDGCRKL